MQLGRFRFSLFQLATLMVGICIVSSLVAQILHTAALRNRIRIAGASISESDNGHRITVGPYLNYALSLKGDSEQSPLSDEELFKIVELSARIGNVTEFYLFETDITDNGISYLERLDDLEEVVLVNARLTDTAILNLYRLGGLRKLTIVDCSNISIEGISTFQKARPECLVSYDLNE